MYNNAELTSSVTCSGSVSYRGIGCWTGVITNYSAANAVCYTKSGGWCTNNSENILLKMYVK